jgi:ABC-2 type transport system ATP-binding protein
MSAELLEVRDLRKSYGTTQALRGVSFQVHEGEMFGLLGPNGAGKTTLLSILSCLLVESSGEALLTGKRISTEDRELRRLIGIVPQELAVYGELSARENLLFFGELYDLRGKALHQRVDQVLAAVGLQDRADARVDSYSGGMKRRLNLGAGLIHQPRLLLLDEPTTGVDPQSRNHIFEEVRRINREGVTVVYTSHYMEEVQALCTRIGIMDQGQLVACDTLPALLRQMNGVIRIRMPHAADTLGGRLQPLARVRLSGNGDGAVELECDDVKATLLRLVSVLNELQVELSSLEIEEPNLERVFLHLTGRALRD